MPWYWRHLGILWGRVFSTWKNSSFYFAENWRFKLTRRLKSSPRSVNVKLLQLSEVVVQKSKHSNYVKGTVNVTIVIFYFILPFYHTCLFL